MTTTKIPEDKCAKSSYGTSIALQHREYIFRPCELFGRLLAHSAFHGYVSRSQIFQIIGIILYTIGPSPIMLLAHPHRGAHQFVQKKIPFIVHEDNASSIISNLLPQKLLR